MLFDMRNNIDAFNSDTSSELRKWLVLNGRDTVDKFKTFQKGGFNKPLQFNGKVIFFA